MKILAFCDVHGYFGTVTAVLSGPHRPDIVVVAGDITQFGAPRDIDEAVGAWRPWAPVLLAVAGNMDSPAIERHLDEIGISLNARCREVNGVAFHGCSASQISIGTPYEISEGEIAERLRLAASGCRRVERRVLVTHVPPRGVLDRTHSGVHAGSESVREFVLREQPELLISGHIHEAAGQERLGSTLVVNCGAAMRGHYAVIELDEQGVRAELF